LRFARLEGQIIAFSRIRKHIGGEGRGKHHRVRLFSTRNRPIADVKPETFRSMVQAGLIRRLQLPHSLKTKAEDLSDQIGDVYTPQEALALFQQKLQDHATTLETDVAKSPAPVGEGIAHG
jgi:D-alanyl-D-alanine dipeptidase